MQTSNTQIVAITSRLASRIASRILRFFIAVLLFLKKYGNVGFAYEKGYYFRNSIEAM